MLSNFFLLVSLTECYGEFGCFPVNGHFKSARRPISVPPRSPDAINVSFVTYTRAHPSSPYVIPWTNGTNGQLRLPIDAFNRNKTTKIIIHGFHEDGFTKVWIKNLVGELLKHDDINVVVADWGSGASTLYPEAVANARLVGAILAKFISSLQASFSVSAESFHIIGHSLGAHIAGYAGERIQGLGRITGLDPAQPYFENTHSSVRLDPSDALFVDVIHSDARSMYKGGLGMWQPCGHVDFYPNGGRTQPGCGGGLMPYVHVHKGDFFKGVRNWLTCRHKRAYELFTETVNSPCPFMAVQCSSHKRFREGSCFMCDNNDGYKSQCLPMGYHAGPLPGLRPLTKFYLHTGANQPFCYYHRRVTVYLAIKGSSQVVERGRLFARLVLKSGLQSQRLYFLPKEVEFSSGSVASSVVGTVNSEDVVAVRLMWKKSGGENPLDFFNGHVPSISVDRISVETLEKDQRVIVCLKRRHLYSGKVYVFTPGKLCDVQERRLYADNNIPP